jgi:hypothetical protein
VLELAGEEPPVLVVAVVEQVDGRASQALGQQRERGDLVVVGGEDAQEVATAGWVQRPQLSRRCTRSGAGEADIRAQGRDYRERTGGAVELWHGSERAARVERPHDRDHVGGSAIRACVGGALRIVGQARGCHGVVAGLPGAA